MVKSGTARPSKLTMKAAKKIWIHDVQNCVDRRPKPVLLLRLGAVASGLQGLVRWRHQNDIAVIALLEARAINPDRIPIGARLHNQQAILALALEDQTRVSVGQEGYDRHDDGGNVAELQLFDFGAKPAFSAALTAKSAVRCGPLPEVRPERRCAKTAIRNISRHIRGRLAADRRDRPLRQPVRQAPMEIGSPSSRYSCPGWRQAVSPDVAARYQS